MGAESVCPGQTGASETEEGTNSGERKERGAVKSFQRSLAAAAKRWSNSKAKLESDYLVE